MEVTVAPPTASMPLPSITLPLLPMNWLVNASSAHFWPISGVCVEASTSRVAIAPFSSRVT